MGSLHPSQHPKNWNGAEESSTLKQVQEQINCIHSDWRAWLEERREHQRLMMLYKIQNGLVAVDSYVSPAGLFGVFELRTKNDSQYLTLVNRPTRHNYTQAFIVPQSSTDYHQFPFFPRTVSQWNTLPNATVTAPFLDMFRRRLMTE